MIMHRQVFVLNTNNEEGQYFIHSFDRYLGFPLKFVDRGTRDFNFVVHKVQQKLSGWQASLHSLAGRRVLIQSSSNPIPDYVMQGALLPAIVCTEIDRANRNFLWGSTLEKGKMQLANWNTITLPKEHGGLGLHESRPRNLALLTKHNQRLLSEDASPWAQVLKAKYLSNNPNSNPWSSKGAYSLTQAACMEAKPLLNSGLRKVITSGTSTSFWFDIWSPTGTLRSHLYGPLNMEEEHQLVSHMIDSNGNWNFHLSFDLPLPILNILQAVPVNFGSSDEDSLAWAFSNDGNFTLRSAYTATKGLNALNPPYFLLILDSEGESSSKIPHFHMALYIQQHSCQRSFGFKGVKP